MFKQLLYKHLVIFCLIITAEGSWCQEPSDVRLLRDVDDYWWKLCGRVLYMTREARSAANGSWVYKNEHGHVIEDGKDVSAAIVQRYEKFEKQVREHLTSE